MMQPIEITKHLMFPFQFDKLRLLKDLNLVLKENWIDHFNKNGYEGSWNSIALYAPSGDPTNIYAMSSNASVTLEETDLLDRCIYFKEVLAQFKCSFLSVRLLRLGVGAYIKPHKDHKLGYEDNCFRVHVPITTNPEVSFILDDVRLNMLPGQCWYTNVNYTHSVSNSGTTDRVHLVFDCERNKWSDELFYSLAPAESFRVPDKKPVSRQTLKRIIEELEISKPSGYRNIIEQLKAD